MSRNNELYQSEGAGSFFLSPDNRYSFAVGEVREGMYQILQLALQKLSPAYSTDLHYALHANDPNALANMLGVKFNASHLYRDDENLRRVEDAYSSSMPHMVSDPADMVFRISMHENESQQLHVVAGAYGSRLRPSVYGGYDGLELSHTLPYSLYYFLIGKNNQAQEDLLDISARKHIDWQELNATHSSEPDICTALNSSIFNSIRSYMKTSRVLSGSSAAFSSV